MIKKIFAELEKLDDSVVSRIPVFCSYNYSCDGCRMLEVKRNLDIKCSEMKDYVLGKKSMHLTPEEGVKEVIKKYFEYKKNTKYWRV